MTRNIALITVTHDPLGKNINLIKKFAKDLKKLYSDMFITVSNQSNSEVIKVLEENHFKVKIIQKLGAAHARREVLKFGLSSTSNFFHYCDFDRLLTWISKHAGELELIVNDIMQYDYLILGRTERAFHTHPIEWIETEKITNRITSLELGQEVDVTAGSCAFSRKSAILISKHSKEKMTDAEWPMIVYRIGCQVVSYKATEGLEYNEEVNGIRNEVNESEKWLGRLRLSYIISESAVNVGKSSE